MFAKPVVPQPGNVTVPACSGVGQSKGEKDKEKPKRKAAPSPSPVRGGAVGGGFVDDNGTCVPPNTNNTERSVVKYTLPTSGKGRCNNLVIV